MDRGPKRRHSGTRYILTRVEAHYVAFPTTLVGEIVPIDRSAILSLPIYPQRCLGVAHYRGQSIPLCTLPVDVTQPERPPQGMLIAIRLSEKAGSRMGVGIAVNQIFGQVSEHALNRAEDSSGPASQLDTDLLVNGGSEPDSSEVEIPGTYHALPLEQPPSLPVHMFSLDDVPEDLWRPRRSLIAFSLP